MSDSDSDLILLTSFYCPECKQAFRSPGGLTRHKNIKHPVISFGPQIGGGGGEHHFETHQHFRADHYNIHSRPVPADKSPESIPEPPIHLPEAWYPFDKRSTFDWSHFFYIELKASNGKINKALDILQAQLLEVGGGQTPFRNTKDLYAAIDSIREENTPWITYNVKYTGELPDNPPLWMTEVYKFCVHDTLNVLIEQLKTKAFRDQFNYTPYQEWNTRNERIYSNLLSGDWIWDTADEISRDPELSRITNGAMLVPIILGSDKTTVSVDTGHQEYHPAYISPGNLTNIAWRAHGNSVLPFMFFAIPRSFKSK
ncbi:hypothetical protein E1B28_000117 [Marasmius oreades]|uniref:C2H2-type domain-containing protein n=1 Tax=Marasmius oreades TaxID=181124 RepID=A0A9P7V0S4_9AGAR|nr:uncharacterized protein E1B28_000117 [Marasmius oreades]KAG7098147.1 hypothetical protein E1B28_000117 [Marasmius oreades]